MGVRDLLDDTWRHSWPWDGAVVRLEGNMSQTFRLLRSPHDRHAGTRPAMSWWQVEIEKAGIAAD